MEIINKLNVVLKESKINSQYGVKNIPTRMSDTDIRLNKILDGYLHFSSKEKLNIRSLITTEIAWLLLCFGIRMATYSLRLSDQRYFTNGLLALSMTLGILDEREIMVILVLYCDVQIKNNLSFQKILEQNDAFAALLENFIKRSEQDKSLDSMGYTLLTDENNNLVCERTW